MLSSRIICALRRTYPPRCISYFSTLRNEIHLAFPRAPKLVVGEENHFSYRVLQKYDKYKIVPYAVPSPIEKIDENPDLNSVKWDNFTDEEICRLFHRISSLAATEGTPISDPKYTDMCVYLSKRFPEMNDSHLRRILKYLSLWPVCSSVREPNFYTVWKSLDTTFDARFRDYSTDKAFELVNLWFNVQLARKSDFVYHIITRMADRPSKLKPDQVVLLLFYLNILRSAAKGVNMFTIQEKLALIVDKLTIEEIGVACMGFFKTQTMIQHHALLNSIITKLIDNVETVPDITLVCIVKALRYKLPISLWDRLPELVDALLSQINRITVTACSHIPLLLTSSLTVHTEILESVSQKLVDEIDSARLKDMEKVAFCLTVLNYRSKVAEEVLKSIASQLEKPERETELENHPKCLVAVLHYLAMNEIFVDNLIDRVLEAKFISETYGKSKYAIGREILFLDTTMELENPKYNGNRLVESTRNYLSKRYSEYLPDPERPMSFHRKFMFDVIQTVERLTKNNCAPLYLLPNHPRADIIIRQSDEEFLPLPSELTQVESFTGSIPAPDSGYLALMTLSRNMLLKNTENGLMGECLVKIRQLKKLGYCPILVRHDEWPNNGSNEEKEDHVLRLIRSSFSSHSAS